MLHWNKSLFSLRGELCADSSQTNWAVVISEVEQVTVCAGYEDMSVVGEPHFRRVSFTNSSEIDPNQNDIGG